MTDISIKTKICLPVHFGESKDNGLKFTATWVQECEISDSRKPGENLASRDKIINEIYSGGICPPFAAILEIDAEAGTVRDIEKEIASELSGRSLHEKWRGYEEFRDWLYGWGLPCHKEE